MRKNKKTHEKFVNQLKQIQPELEVLSEYKGSDEKILVKDKNNIKLIRINYTDNIENKLILIINN